ncbi:murein DD-endopeptidase MepM/ murein hydrolase activator NlpD [Caulobacter ginsengisoli]|uniref:Murein DD-endopeptidase MepM/ murein hydrolase activator NlpD n=1 Tax=Caulobacter ginsengisoli TaxID=400775 RepID=A0ABU0IR85_9CAUL|nr:M23 family metallopeptidase [Caulobacter ginsengisoli]MDQ0464523.1 murein DD-endopeptidase MepM/ murein hydrolase activator NlpD [Caulobacter ginsengisoli]
MAIGRTLPRAAVFVDNEPVGQASASGLFVIGFDRDSGPSCSLRVETEQGPASQLLSIAPGDFDIQAINGLPDNQVDNFPPDLLARIKAEAARKRVGFASQADSDDFRAGFRQPLDKYRLSARFGGQRILNGVPKTPHYGADLAAPTGTPIHAPCAGQVCFAEAGLHFDGGLTMIDHGQGLISLYLHQSRLVVQAGQRVQAGDLIGSVGKEGRATGPHLCWRMKWRGRNLDPLLMVGISAPGA